MESAPFVITNILPFCLSLTMTVILLRDDENSITLRSSNFNIYLVNSLRISILL